MTVYSSSEQIAVEQVKIEEKQRVLGIIPNFYVIYDHDPAPLTKTLKFKLALKASTDPVIFLGAATLAAINQAADRPDYVQGAKGYGQRLGAGYADAFTNLMIGGAILPSFLPFSIRTRDTSIRGQGQGGLAFSTLSPAHSSAKVIAESGS